MKKNSRSWGKRSRSSSNDHQVSGSKVKVTCIKVCDWYNGTDIYFNGVALTLI